MSGHSKFANIKHKKEKKNRREAQERRIAFPYKPLSGIAYVWQASLSFFDVFRSAP